MSPSTWCFVNFLSAANYKFFNLGINKFIKNICKKLITHDLTGNIKKEAFWLLELDLMIIKKLK